MRSTAELDTYQVDGIKYLLARPRAVLRWRMGKGKTATTLHALAAQFDRMNIHGVLIIAPLSVCLSVWEAEARSWEYTAGLTFSTLVGTAEQRRAALYAPAQIYVINYENLPWLAEEIETAAQFKKTGPPFNCVVFDELSLLKSTRTRQGGAWGKALRPLFPYLPYRIGLTGTLLSNGYLDLFGQYLCIDAGGRLGTSFASYQETYFYRPGRSEYKWLPFEGAKTKIQGLIEDITFSYEGEDHAHFPGIVYFDEWTDLPDPARAVYKKAEKDFFVQFYSGKTLELDSRGSLINRCLQISNGACYVGPKSREWEEFHTAKLDVLDALLQKYKDTQVLVAYAYKHDEQRIKERHPHAVSYSAKLTSKKTKEILSQWNARRIPLLIGHPASMGHGLNLQHGGSVVIWFGLCWSLDLYAQLIARIGRRGQKDQVQVHHILARNTLDLIQLQVLKQKDVTAKGFYNAIDYYGSSREYT